MSKKRKLIIALVAFSGIVAVGLGIHFKPTSPRINQTGGLLGYFQWHAF